jgi:hypothetical protein
MTDKDDKKLWIDYVSLDTLKRWERNPKDHDLGELGRSLSRFGFVMPILIDERSNKIAAGHGRIDTLLQRREMGESPPARIDVQDGEWMVPVVRGVNFNSDGEMEAYAVADNRLVERGGWDEPALTAVLKDLAEGPGLDGTGYDEDDLDALLAFTSMMGEFEDLPDLEWDEPEKAWRVIILCDEEAEVLALLQSLGLPDDNTSQVRYSFSDTALAK